MPDVDEDELEAELDALGDEIALDDDTSYLGETLFVLIKRLLPCGQPHLFVSSPFPFGKKLSQVQCGGILEVKVG